MPHASLKFRLFSIIIIVFLPIIGLLLWSSIYQRQAIRNASEVEALQLTRIIAADQREVIENTRHLLSVLSVIEDVQTHNKPGCDLILKNLYTQHAPRYTNFFSVGLDGYTRCRSSDSTAVTDNTDRSWFQSLIQNPRDYVVSGYVIGKVSGEPVIVVAMPLFDENQTFTGIIAAGISLDWLNSAISTLKLPTDSKLTLLDESYRVLARYPESDLQIGGDYLNRTVLNALEREPQGLVHAPDKDGVNRVYAFMELQPGIAHSHIILGLSEPVAFASVHDFERLSIVSLVIIGLLAVVMVWSSTTFITKPVHQLVKMTEHVAEGDLDVQVERVSSISEINQLTHTFNRMAASVKQRVEERTQALAQANTQLALYTEQLKTSNNNLQHFAYIASHDLQEPLRKIQMFGNRIEQKHRSELSPETVDYLQRMINASRRMQTLIDGLLQFSKVETERRKFKAVDLNQVVAQVISDLEPQIEEQQAQIHITSALPTVPGDSIQLQQVFQNLIGNALKYTRPDITPEIIITTMSHNNQIEIQVCDNGIGFAPENAQRIFGLFERLHGRSTYEGTGIGLAIVKRIIERHHGLITATGQPNQGAIFTIKLPYQQTSPIS